MEVESFSSHNVFAEVGSDIEDDFEIVEHEQAHAVAVATGRDMSGFEEEEGRSSRADLEGSNFCEPFLDHFAGMIDSTNSKSILREQDHM